MSTKRFKFRLSHVIPSFRFCRSKHASCVPHSPVRVLTYHKRLDLRYPNFTLLPNPPPPPPTPQDTTPLHPMKSGDQSPLNTWTSQRKWYTVGKDDEDEQPRRKIYSAVSSCSGDVDDEGLAEKKKCLKRRNKSKTKKKKKKKTMKSTSSGSDSGWFTSEETETFLSSRSFSNDSTNNEIKSDGRANRYKNVDLRKLGKPRKLNGYKTVTADIKPPPPQPPRTRESKSKAPLMMMMMRGTVLGRMMMTTCNAEGKVKESFAVVKKSVDPYEDFKVSMLEMIMEKQMFGAEDLEELLRCFLALNSKQHHGVIVEAFTEIWEILFSKS